MESNEVGFTEENFGVELAKVFAVTAAATAGALAGSVLVVAVVGWFSNRKAPRANENAQENN